MKRIYSWEPWFFILLGTAVFVLGIVLMVRRKTGLYGDERAK